MASKVKKLRVKVDADMDVVYQRLAQAFERIETLETQIKALNQRCDALLAYGDKHDKALEKMKDKPWLFEPVPTVSIDNPLLFTVPAVIETAAVPSTDRLIGVGVC